MNRTLKTFAFTAIALLLPGCSKDDNKSVATVEDLNPGAYIVSVGEPNAPTVGLYYAGTDGSRLLALASGNDQAEKLYRRTVAVASWVAIPAIEQAIDVTLLHSDAIPIVTANVATLVGNYVTQISPEVRATFSIQADGSIVAGATSCKLFGHLSVSTLPNSLRLDLETSGCVTLPALSTGVLALDSEYSPARFRLIGDDGRQVIDLWAYAD